MKATTTTQRRAAKPSELDGHPVPVAAPGRLRRRPSMVLMSVVLVLLGGVLALLVWTMSTTSSEVVAVRVPVDRGEIITGNDLVVARISVDPSLKVIPAVDLQRLVGQRAASDLAAGTLVSPDQVTTAVVPRTGESVVGVAVSLGRLPAEPLRPGDRVRLVETSGDQGETPVDQTVIEAVVQGVSAAGSDGVSVVVDVVVPAARAPEVAARGAVGRLAIVLDSRER